MANWARLCDKYEREVWINEESVERLCDITKGRDILGCTIFFNNYDSEPLEVIESSDDILSLWKRWHEGRVINTLDLKYAKI